LPIEKSRLIFAALFVEKKPTTRQKMSSRTKKSFAWLWIAALLTAKFGISMERIYCYCVGTTTVALFAAEGTCEVDATNADSACCAKPTSRPAHSCCQPDDESGLKKHNGCMEKSTKIFQLKTEFVVDKPLDKSFDCPLWLQEMPVFRRYLRPAVCDAVFRNKPPPPPLSGRDICLRHQLFRC
jgi:hypothetical protein